MKDHCIHYESTKGLSVTGRSNTFDMIDFEIPQGRWVTTKKKNPKWWFFYVGLIMLIGLCFVGLFAGLALNALILMYTSNVPEGMQVMVGAVIGIFDGCAILVWSHIILIWGRELPSPLPTTTDLEYIYPKFDRTTK